MSEKATIIGSDASGGREGDREVLMQVRDVHKTYVVGSQDVPAVRGVTLEIVRGETLSIQGASGAGKTTLLHVLGGLDEPTQGTVHYRGDNIYTFSEARRSALRGQHLGFVFQSYHLLPELTVLENVMLPSLNHWAGVGRAATNRRKARQLLEKVGMGHRLEHRPVELSGGEQQRTALARALINDPEVIFADEPTGNLDSKTGDLVLALLFELVEDRNDTLVMVTHNDSVAGQCERNLVLQDGAVR